MTASKGTRKKTAPKKVPRVAKPAAVATSLVLRTCDENLRSKRGFQWPESGFVEAPDWKETPECGNGLHGWLHGEGDHSCSSYLDATAKWLVVEVATHEIIMLGGKVKFPRGNVVFVGDRKSATDYLIANEPNAKNVHVIGASITVGDNEAAIAGSLGTATAGDSGTATAGSLGTATAGDRGTATAGSLGTATAGDRGTATAGDSGTATAGDSGTATAGSLGTATAGYRGELRIRWWDSSKERYRTEVAYVGENSIEPNVAYKLDDNHKFVKVKP